MFTGFRMTLLAGLLACAVMAFATVPPSPTRGRGVPASPQGSLPPRLTDEKAFFYFIAIYGSPDNVVERYGTYFDAVKYRQAMADEFERARYVEKMRARIADGVAKINFRDKFTLVGSTTFEGYTMLGEYSFASHSFPLINVPYDSFCRNMDHSSGICSGSFLDVRSARVRDAVNGTEFDWSVPMSEADARAFVKSRAMGQPGAVDRRVVVRMIYSIVNKKSKSNTGRSDVLSPFIYSVEVFRDDGLTRKLGVITARPGTPITAFLPETVKAAQSSNKVLNTYRYTASCGEFYKCETPIVGPITLTDVGVDLTGEQRDGSAKPTKHSFLEAFAEGSTRLWRANFRNGTWGGDDFRVVWQPFWDKDYRSELIFAGHRERDRFFRDVTTALQQWSVKYAQFAGSKLNVDQRCEINTYMVQCPDEEAQTPVPAGQGDSSLPTLETRVEAQYSEVARKAGIQGVVVVKCSVDDKGNVVSTEVLKALPFGLDVAAVTAVRQWKFRPAQKDGQAVPSTYEAVVTFSLASEQ